MGRYERKDIFYKKAKQEGHLSRAYYKLEEIEDRFRIIRRGDKVLDLGCAPGGWLEVASHLVGKKGLVVGIDLETVKIKDKNNIHFIQGDIFENRILDDLKREIDKFDVVISDMAPPTSGVKFRDSFLSYELADRALQIAKNRLKEGGNFVTKIFPGEELPEFKNEMQKLFVKVKQFRPKSTRKTSNEIYLIGSSFKNKTGRA